MILLTKHRRLGHGYVDVQIQWQPLPAERCSYCLDDDAVLKWFCYPDDDGVMENCCRLVRCVRRSHCVHSTRTMWLTKLAGRVKAGVSVDGKKLAHDVPDDEWTAFDHP